MGMRGHIRQITPAELSEFQCRMISELELAQEYFEHLSRYYSEAATSGNGMLLYIV